MLVQTLQERVKKAVARKAAAKKKASKKPKATKRAKATKKTAGKGVLGAVNARVGIEISGYKSGKKVVSRTGQGEIDTKNKTAVIEWIDNWWGVPRLHGFYTYELKVGGQTFRATLTETMYPGRPNAIFKLL